VVDDQRGRTVAAAHDREVATGLTGVARATAVGTLVAERARQAGVAAVVFDRRHYRYHGQVRALAEGARAAGLAF
jgi:large subunit ribosomal protein L18